MNKRRDKELSDIHLTPEQIAEIERRLTDDESYASDEQVRAVFNRLTKKARVSSRRKL